MMKACYLQITRINDLTLLKHRYNLKLKAKGPLLVSATGPVESNHVSKS